MFAKLLGKKKSKKSSPTQAQTIEIVRPEAVKLRGSGQQRSSQTASAPSLPGRDGRSDSDLSDGVPIRWEQAKDPSFWTNYEVGNWLKEKSLVEVAMVLVQNNVDGGVLLDLNDVDLIDMKITKLGDRKRLLRLIKDLKKEQNSDLSVSSSLQESSLEETSSQNSRSRHHENSVQFIKDGIEDLCVDLVNFSFIGLTGALAANVKDGSEYAMMYLDLKEKKRPLRDEGRFQKAVKASKGVFPLYVYLSRWDQISSLSTIETGPLETMLDPIVAISTTGKILFWNHRAEEELGYTKGETIGQRVEMLMPHQHAKEHKKYMKNYLETGISMVIGKTRQVHVIKKDRQQIRADLSVSEIKDEKGQPSYFLGIIRKVADVDRQSLPIQTHFQMIHGMVDAAVVIDVHGIIVVCNDRAGKLWGYKTADLVGRNIKILMPSPFREEHDSYLSNYHRSGIGKVMERGRDVPIQTRKGEILPVHLKLSKQDIEGETYYMGILTPAQLSEDQLQKSLLDIEREALKSLQFPGIIIGDKGIIQAWNDPATSFLGYSLAEIIGKNIKIIMPPEIANKHDDYLRRYNQSSGESKIIGKGRRVTAMTKDKSLVSVTLWITKKTDPTDGSIFFIGLIQPDIE